MTEPPIAVPVCYRHPSRETYVRCVRCDRPICPDCMREASVGHQCPECVAEGRRTQRPARTAFGGGHTGERGYVTKILIAVNCVMALISAASAGNANALGGQGFAGLLGGVTPLTFWGGLIGGPTSFHDDQNNVIAVVNGVADGDYYRLLTSMFLHFGLLHLVLNMYALWILGRSLEHALGPLRFLALYLIAGLGGSVAVYLFTNPHSGPTAGASGAIFGLFAALIVVLRRLGGSVSGVLPVLVINLILTFGIPGISIAGHLGGMVTGAIVAAGLAYAPRRWRTEVQTISLTAVMVLLVVLTVVHTAMLSGPGA